MDRESYKNAVSVRVASCDLCNGELKFAVPPRSVIRAVKCVHCGETAAVDSPPPNNLFTRCPYCAFLLVHSVDALTVVCPRVRCGKIVNVSGEETNSSTCDICGNTLIYRKQTWLTTCSYCCEAVAVGPTPKGTRAVRCLCNALLIPDCNVRVITCPRKNCGRLLQLLPSQISGQPAMTQTSVSRVGACVTRMQSALTQREASSVSVDLDSLKLETRAVSTQTTEVGDRITRTQSAPTQREASSVSVDLDSLKLETWTISVEETVSALSSLLLHNDHTKEVNGVVGCSEKKSATVSGQKVEMEKREGLSNITPELVINSPTSLMDVKHGATALPLCPPNTAVPSSLHAGLLQPQEVPCFTNAASPFEEPPPPYTLLPPVYPQLPVASTSQEGQAMTEANLIQCAVCKYEGKYCQSPGRMISLVRCSRCKEHTPVVPPPTGKVYGRCAFCHCLNVYSTASKALKCRRETCKEVLFVSVSGGKMIKRMPCEVCRCVMHIVQDINDVTASTLHICSQCGEANALGPPPPGRVYTRCPYCNVFMKHNSSTLRMLCPRSTCKRFVEVGNGEKLSVTCGACQNKVIYYGRRNVVVCSHCGKGMVVGKPPAGKGYFLCSCNSLLVYETGSSAVVKCPQSACGKVAIIAMETTTAAASSLQKARKLEL